MKLVVKAMLATLIGAAPLVAAETASAGGRVYYRDGHSHPAGRTHYPYRPYYGPGPGAGAGFVAGAALGLGAGLLIARPPPPVYYAPPPPPVYYVPPPAAYYPPPPPPVYYNRSWTEAHIEWCLARYRSYNPATNTFTGYDGLQHECRGPY